MKKRVLLLILLLNMFAINSFANIVSKENKKIKIGLVMSSGGLGSGYNQMAYSALVRLKEEGKIDDFKYVEPNSVAEDSQYLSDFSNGGEYDLIIGMGSVVATSLVEIQKKYPKQKYILVGSKIVPNTSTLYFSANEASFLAGALAAMKTETGVIGIIPAFHNAAIGRYINGYIQGAKYINENIKVLNTPVPTTSSNPFNDPVTGKNIALVMNDMGADVIYHIAETTGLGVFEAAKERGFYAIGCDEDEDGKMPGVILTSVRIRIDNGIYSVIDSYTKGKFQAGYVKTGLKSGGVSLTEFKYTKDKITKEQLNTLKKIEKEIVLGKIVVKE